jgi:small-conductance mechanosensitive channel
MANVFTASWFYWAIGIALGLPVGLVLLTEWERALRRRGSTLLRPVTLLKSYLLPLGALLLLMIGAAQIPATSTPVRIVGTAVAVVVLVLVLAGIKALLFQSAPDGTWRQRIPAIFVDVVRFGLIAIGIGLIFAYIWGAHVGKLFTAFGVTSVVIGLMLQNSVGQIISGLMMLFEQPFRLGDWLETPAAKGRVVEVNWRAVHLDTSTGMQITPNSVLAGASFKNLSRPVGRHDVEMISVFAVDDRPDQVCAMLERIASQLPQLRSGADPKAVPVAPMTYRTTIPLRSPGDGSSAKATFLRWIWYAARREGLHLDESEDVFSEPDLVADAIHRVVAPTLRLTVEQQQDMAASASIECYGSGELIQPAGTVPEAVSFILAGTVLLTVEDDSGVRTEINSLKEGSFFGQGTLVRNSVPGSAYALDEVTVIRVAREAIEEVVQQNPLLLEKFGRVIAERRAAVVRALEDSPPAGNDAVD